MAAKLSDRLKEASRRLFVGREAQCKLFDEVLTSGSFSFSMLHIHGPGGIGKTSLLYEFRRLCDVAGIPVVYLDTRTIEADPVVFSDALAGVMSLGSQQQPEEALGAEGKHILMLDTFEAMYSLEQWLYTEFFPELLDTVFIVIAGRYPPSSNWTDNPGWRSLIKEASLRNLSPEECRLFLSKAGMPDESHQAVIEYTHGHPLALSLVSESFGKAPAMVFDGEPEPDFIKVLLDRFVREAPSLEHRLAMEACVLANHLTEPLLAAMIDETNVRSLFEWLRNLSFIESGPRGLFPHDLARDVLGTELKWRNPDDHKALHKRARAYYNHQLQHAPQAEQGNILKDYIFLHRDNSIVRPFFVQLQSQWQGGPAPVSTDRYRAGDLENIVNMVVKHEGEDAGEKARMWIQQQPGNVIVFRNPEGQVEGFLLSLALHEATDELLKRDPIAKTCKQFIDDSTPLRPNESATLFRFWMDAASYQNISQVQSLIFVYMVRHYLTTPGLAYSMLPISSPSFWKSVFLYADLEHLEELDYQIGGVPYGVFGHDWRSRPPAAWLDVLASRETGGSTSASTEEAPRRPIIVLSEEAFTEAVRQALRNYTRPDRLAKNPLLSSRVVVEGLADDADANARIEVLMRLIDERIELLQNNPKQVKAYRALDRTYLRPAASQEQAAEMLNVPYSSFRRHLSAAVTEITAALWQKEIGQ